MRLRTTIVMAVLALLGLAYIVVVENFDYPDRYQSDKLARIISFQPENVTEFEINISGKPISCTAQDGEWQITEPVNAQADNSSVNQFLAALAKLKSNEVITRSQRAERGITFADYGLAPPFAVIRIEGDGLRRLINIGSRSRDRSSVYVACDNAKNDIFSVDSSFLDSVPSSVSRLRSKMIFAYEPKDVSRVEIKTADGFISMVASEDGVWSLQQPIAARAEQAKVVILIESICKLKIVRFLPDLAPNASIYGFDEVDSVVTLYEDGDVTGTELHLGLPIKDDPKMIYAYIKGDDALFALPAKILDSLRSVRSDDLRSRDLLDVDANVLQAVKIDSSSSNIEMIKKNKSWSMVSPRKWKADGERIESLLSMLVAAKVREFRAIKDESAWLGFDTNSVFVSLSDTPASKEDAEQSGQDERYRIRLEVRKSLQTSALSAVKVDGRDWVSLVGGDLYQSIATVPVHYRDREVLSLDLGNIESIKLKSAAGEQVLEKAKDGTWQALGIDRGQTADVMPQKSRFENLQSLTCVEFVVSGEYSPSDYGLESPAKTLTVILSGEGSISKSILFGDKLPDGSVYACIRGQDSVFRLDQSTAESLCSDLYELTDDSSL